MTEVLQTKPIHRGRGSKTDNPLVTSVERTGSLVAFAISAIKSVPVAARQYPAEVLRQAALYIRSNTAIIVFLMFMLSALVGITGSYLFENVGLESYVAAITSVAMMRGVAEIVFGWVLAAKSGCGMVAELGAMRISEEIDALEVMGVRSMPYLVGTRILASILVVPFMWTAALLVLFASSHLFFVNFLNTVSSGGYEYVLYLTQSPRDLAISVFWGTFLGVLVTIVSGYYGYNAKGGPVGVGRATAQAMLVNLVLINASSGILAQIFYASALKEAVGT